MITQEELKEILDYNPNTGVFVWKVSKSGVKRIGSLSGSLKKDGYSTIVINRKEYKAHRLTWLWVYGEFPKGQIDHINGVRNDNRIENLRDVTPRENLQNKICHREGHLIGTTYSKQYKKWRSQIQINSKRISLGYYETKEQAHEAYLNKLKELENV